MQRTKSRQYCFYIIIGVAFNHPIQNSYAMVLLDFVRIQELHIENALYESDVRFLGPGKSTSSGFGTFAPATKEDENQDGSEEEDVEEDDGEFISLHELRKNRISREG